MCVQPYKIDNQKPFSSAFLQRASFLYNFTFLQSNYRQRKTELSTALHMPIQVSQYIVRNKNQTLRTLPPFPCSPIRYDLNKGKVYTNRMSKPADDIIMPNEYTLDLLPSPLFSGDFLDSQISANNISAGRPWRENSHMIQITSLDNSIWKGEFWSKMYFKKKVNKTFLCSLSKGVPFTLYIQIEYLNTLLMYSLTVTRSSCDLRGTRLLAASD